MRPCLMSMLLIGRRVPGRGRVDIIIRSKAAEKNSHVSYHNVGCMTIALFRYFQSQVSPQELLQGTLMTYNRWLSKFHI